MIETLLRFNFVQATPDQLELASRYGAGIEMSRLADEYGASTVTLEEHHCVENGWSPTPLINAAAILATTRRICVRVSALLVPLYDPVRLAEDIAVLDLIGRGRLTVVGGLGYRAEEYLALGVDWDARGRLMDEAVAALLMAWTGEPFEYRNRTVTLTPRPLSQPNHMFMIGGSSRPAVRRAVRFGLPICFGSHSPELLSYYYALCEQEGKQPFAIVPPRHFAHHFVDEDPDAAWEEIGHYLLHESQAYAQWQSPRRPSGMRSSAKNVAELRQEGRYQILTPDEVLREARDNGGSFSLNLHPLCGGIPVATAWRFFHNYLDGVAPSLRMLRESLLGSEPPDSSGREATP